MPGAGQPNKSESAALTRRRWRGAARLCVGLGVLALLVHSIGLPMLASSFHLTRLEWVPALALSLLMFFVLGATNVWVLLRALHGVPFLVFVRAYTYCFLVGAVTPGGLGDASLVAFLKRDGVPARCGAVAYALDKFITLCILVVVACAGARAFLPEINRAWLILLPVAGAIAVMGSAWFVRSVRLPWGPVRRLQLWVDSAITEFGTYRRQWPVLLLNIGLTVLKWLVMSLCYFVGFLCFGVLAKWPAIGVFPVLSTLVSYIPVSFSGLGTKECTAVYLFAREGIDRPITFNVFVGVRFLLLGLVGVMFLVFLRQAGRPDGRLPEAAPQVEPETSRATEPSAVAPEPQRVHEEPRDDLRRAANRTPDRAAGRS